MATKEKKSDDGNPCLTPCDSLIFFGVSTVYNYVMTIYSSGWMGHDLIVLVGESQVLGLKSTGQPVGLANIQPTTNWAVCFFS